MKVKVGKAIVKAFRQKAAKATAKGMKQVKPSSPKIAPPSRKQAKNTYNFS